MTTAKALATIRPYFQSRMLAVSKEFREWEDAFNEDNIPNSELNCAWHLLLTGGSLVSFNQHCLSMDVAVTLSAWEKGFKTPIEAVDSGLKKLEAIIQECCRHSKRLNQPFIKNVVPSGFNIGAINSTNDNIAKLVIQFTLRIHFDIET